MIQIIFCIMGVSSRCTGCRPHFHRASMIDAAICWFGFLPLLSALARGSSVPASYLHQNLRTRNGTHPRRFSGSDLGVPGSARIDFRAFSLSTSRNVWSTNGGEPDAAISHRRRYSLFPLHAHQQQYRMRRSGHERRRGGDDMVWRSGEHLPQYYRTLQEICRPPATAAVKVPPWRFADAIGITRTHLMYRADYVRISAKEGSV